MEFHANFKAGLIFHIVHHNARPFAPFDFPNRVIAVVSTDIVEVIWQKQSDRSYQAAMSRSWKLYILMQHLDATTVHSLLLA